MTGDGVVQAPDDRRWFRTPHSWWSVARIALVAMWVGWAALTWWSAPRHATVEQARADLSAGRAAGYEWADDWSSDDGFVFGWGRPPTLRSSGTAGPLFVWRTPDWRIRYAVLDDVRPSESFPASPDSDASAYSGPEAASLGHTIRAAGQESAWAAVNPPAPIAMLILALGLGSLLILIGGPAPVTGTRWFWFWLISAAPFGLGLLYWLGRERPWSRTAVTRAGPTGKDTRRGGILGIGLAVVAMIATSLLAYWLNRLLGSHIVPLPAS
jgi:hypothetical protein